ncbi:MAG TPA: response regulator [Deltaproteobacteria bacterium]|nr:response regulator [Deltaproteobacteria bacterium]HQB39219.1 response regulator [Deltaproteobacteria bacterium]
MSKKILVVDDEEVISAYLQKKLEKLGYCTIVANDGEKALNAAINEKPDIVLMDVKLPRMTGTDVCRLLKTDPKTANIPVILLSAKAQPAEIQAGLDAGADKYLCKPASFPEILETIRSFESA